MIKTKHTVLLIGLVLILLALPFVTWLLLSTTTNQVTPPTEVTLPSNEEAERTAFSFMLNLLQLAQTPTDMVLMDTMFTTLSIRAQSQISQNRFLRDALAYAGMQTTPEGGVSVEDLQFTSPREATLIVGLNYNTGRELRAIHLIVEDSQWKVDLIDVLSSYPPEDIPPQLPEVATTTESELPPDTLGACYVGGCSSQLCTDDPEAASDCAFRESYTCYQTAICERQSTGQCGWTETPELLACIASAEAL
jgi:hypothetical protein